MDTIDMDFDDIFLRYQAYRKAGVPLASKLSEQLFQNDLLEGGRTLGFLGKKDTFIFENQNEMDILMDFSLFAVLHQGKNVIDRCLEGDLASYDETERKLLTGMARSRYAILIIQDIEPGTGLFALDILRSTEYPIFLADYLFSETAAPNSVMAGRIMPMDEFFITSGATVPVFGRRLIQEIDRKIVEWKLKYPAVLTADPDREADAWLQRAILRLLIKAGMTNRVAYGHMDDDPEALIENIQPLPAARNPLAEESEARKIGPNQRCPCGSGKKYKKCCGRLA